MTGPVGPVRHGDHMNVDDIVTEVARWPDTCESGVYRGNDYVECGKPAIGIRVVESDDESAAAGVYGWPVCVAHARVGHMVALRDILEWHGQLVPSSRAAL